MEAKDLMIGDWVEPHQCRIPTLYCKVEGIYPDNTVHLDKAERLFNLDELHPIPLTVEILEKNGFEVQDQGGGRKDVWIGFGIDCEGDIEVEFQHNIPTYLKIDGAFKGEYYSSTNIKYVHLLQHALRLCGVEKEIIL